MQAVYDILSSLGLNNTVLYQMGLFFIAYFFMSQFLFKPYIRNLEYRRKLLGKSGTSTADDLLTKVEQLDNEYKEKLRLENERTQQIFAQQRSEALAESEKQISEVRAKAARLLDETKRKIQDEVATARAKLETEVPKMSAMIAGKILGREIR